MADALPDATDLAVRVETGPEALQGKSLQLRVPGTEVANVKAGGLAALGLIEGDSVCICVAAAPTTDPEAVRNWLERVACRDGS